MHYPKNIHACLCRFGIRCLTQNSARLTERRKMNNLCGRQFRFTTLEMSVSLAKGIFKLRKIAWSILDGWNFKKHWDSEDLEHLLESRHLDLLMVVYRTCLIQALFVQMFVHQQDMEHWTEVRMKHVEKIRAVNDIKKRKNCTKTAGVSDHSHAVLRHSLLGDS